MESGRYESLALVRGCHAKASRRLLSACLRFFVYWFDQRPTRLTPSTLQGCAKEFVISRSPPFVHVFNMEEHGRRFFRRLIFSTDAARCLHHLPPTLQASSSAASELGTYIVCSGDASTPSSASARLASLVIRRNLSGQLGNQTLIPARLLYGYA